MCKVVWGGGCLRVCDAIKLKNSMREDNTDNVMRIASVYPDRAIVGVQTTPGTPCMVLRLRSKRQRKEPDPPKRNCFTYSISNGRNPFSPVGIPYVLEHLMSFGRTVLLQRDVFDGPTWKTHFGLLLARLATVSV